MKTVSDRRIVAQVTYIRGTLDGADTSYTAAGRQGNRAGTCHTGGGDDSTERTESLAESWFNPCQLTS
jgi:hypothetical protein